MLTIFEATRELVFRSSGAYTHEKFPNFCIWVFPGPKNSETGGACLWEACSSYSKLSGIVFGASRRPKGVPFVHKFWWKTYGLGAVSHRKNPNFGVWCHHLDTVCDTTKGSHCFPWTDGLFTYIPCIFIKKCRSTSWACSTVKYN